MAKPTTRRPRRTDAARARAAQAKAEPPIRFVADYDHVEPNVTTAYKAGMVLAEPPAAVRARAIAAGKAVPDGK